MENAVTDQRPPLVCLPHAVTSDGRQLSYAAFLPRETLGAYIERTGVIVPRGTVVVWHNGRRVPDALWRRLIPRTGDQVVIRARVRGGGGGGKLFRTVALIALTIAANVYGTQVGVAMGLTGNAATAVGTAAIMVGGTLVINALLPPPAPTNLGSNDKYSSSPTYAIQGGRNRARQWEPMLLIFGRHKVVPDLAANPYTEYVGDDQYLRQAFHFGLQPDLIIGEMRIGSTPISEYKGVQVTRSDTETGALPSVAGNVDTLQGFELRYADGWNSRTTPDDTEAIEIELAARLFAIDEDDGSFLTRSVLVEMQYRKVGDTEWIGLGNIKDPVYAKNYWSLGRMTTAGSGESTGTQFWQQVEYGSADPTEHTVGETVTRCSGTGGDAGYYCTTYTWRWIAHPHAMNRPWRGLAPNPLLGYTQTDGYRLSNNSSDIVRRTVTVEVERGQYEIRIRKRTADLDGNSESNATSVSQIRAYQADDADYSGQLRLGVSIRASAQLNGAIDELSAICSAQCWVWTGAAWEIQETSNPAWWYLWYARGKRDNDGRRLYGACLADTRIEIEAIKAWAAWCDEKKLTFDYVLDRAGDKIGDVLQRIARAGRASPSWQTGRLGVIWDAADLPVTAMFGPFNIRAGSFKIEYINDGTADEIVVNFANKDRDYDLDEVRVPVPGAAVTNNPLTVDLEGCVHAEMAGKEANLLAASQVWHRRRVSWETDIEGFIASRGDVIQMSHDLTVWDYSGRLMPGSGGQTMVLDKAVPSGGSGVVMLRSPEGHMKIVSVVSDLGDVDRLTITTPLDGEGGDEAFPMPGDSGYDDIVPMDWAWFFGPLATPGRRLKITDVRPKADGVAFSAIDDDPQYYASENDPYQYTPPRDGALLGGVVLGVQFGETIRSIAADDIQVQVNWAISVSGAANVDLVVNGVAASSITTTGRQLLIDAKTNDLLEITIRPTGAGSAGQPVTRQYLVQGLLAPLPAVVGLTNVFRDGLTTLVWNPVADIRAPGFEIRVGPSWDNARAVGTVPTNEYLVAGNGLHWVAARYTAGGTTIYGAPDSILLSGAALERNVLISQDEAPAWGGTLSDGAVVVNDELTLVGSTDLLEEPDILALDDILLGAGVVEAALYTIAQADQVDVGYVAGVRLDFLLDYYAINLGQNILADTDVLANDDVLSGSDAQYYRVQPQFRVAGEDGVFGPWRNPVPGVVSGRFFDFRLSVATQVPTIIPFVRHFAWVVDVPDLIEQGTDVTVPDTGLTVTYSKTFHAQPNTHIAILDAQDGDRFVLTNQTLSGFDVQAMNGSTPVERQINWRSQGY
ncbi:host specificity factor TipJ family phage tail protein [Bordetella petrii]|uniref:host specificity factor TipJ family phage tail protein n=1 Tax=Bordetella petrii TaxID=94624 RepID=UPI00047C56C0|nr:host specificity factor TipJ family phage tail protein [Bordetella petrii]